MGDSDKKIRRVAKKKTIEEKKLNKQIAEYEKAVRKATDVMEGTLDLLCSVDNLPEYMVDRIMLISENRMRIIENLIEKKRVVDTGRMKEFAWRCFDACKDNTVKLLKRVSKGRLDLQSGRKEKLLKDTGEIKYATEHLAHRCDEISVLTSKLRKTTKRYRRLDSREYSPKKFKLIRRLNKLMKLTEKLIDLM